MVLSPWPRNWRDEKRRQGPDMGPVGVGQAATAGEDNDRWVPGRIVRELPAQQRIGPTRRGAVGHEGPSGRPCPPWPATAPSPSPGPCRPATPPPPPPGDGPPRPPVGRTSAGLEPRTDPVEDRRPHRLVGPRQPSRHRPHYTTPPLPDLHRSPSIQSCQQVWIHCPTLLGGDSRWVSASRRRGARVGVTD